MPDNENRPAGNGADSRATGCNQYIHELRRRRAAAQRTPVLECGRADPWHYPQPDLPSDHYIDGYRDAAEHLLAQGLTPAPNVPAMRGLWRRGGTDRELVQAISERWVVIA